MTEKIRVSASSVISSVAETSAIPARYRAGGAEGSRSISVMGESLAFRFPWKLAQAEPLCPIRAVFALPMEDAMITRCARI